MKNTEYSSELAEKIRRAYVLSQVFIALPGHFVYTRQPMNHFQFTTTDRLKEKHVFNHESSFRYIHKMSESEILFWMKIGPLAFTIGTPDSYGLIGVILEFEPGKTFEEIILSYKPEFRKKYEIFT